MVTVGPVKTDIQLSKNFRLSEFLHSAYAPELIKYRPNAEEMARLRRHVELQLQPLRDRFGRVRITGGARPDSVPAIGPKSGRVMTITEAMQEAGDDAATNSDHRIMRFGVSDFALIDALGPQWVAAYQSLKTDPNTRQVILYYRKVDGSLVPDHIHLATVQPGAARITDPELAAFINVDGKRVSAIV